MIYFLAILAAFVVYVVVRLHIATRPENYYTGWDLPDREEDHYDSG